MRDLISLIVMTLSGHEAESILHKPNYRLVYDVVNPDKTIKLELDNATYYVKEVSNKDKNELPLYHTLSYYRYLEYKDTIEYAALDNSIPSNLIKALLLQESKFNHKLKSKTGVKGIAMITKSTAKQYGINRLDPIDAINGCARILRDLFNRIPDRLSVDDRWMLATFAYNRGLGFTLRHLRGINSYNEFAYALRYNRYSKEGTKYVTKVRQYSKLFN